MDEPEVVAAAGKGQPTAFANHFRSRPVSIIVSFIPGRGDAGDGAPLPNPDEATGFVYIYIYMGSK